MNPHTQNQDGDVSLQDFSPTAPQLLRPWEHHAILNLSLSWKDVASLPLFQPLKMATGADEVL